MSFHQEGQTRLLPFRALCKLSHQLMSGKKKMQFGWGNAHESVYLEPMRLIRVNADRLFKKGHWFGEWREHPWTWNVNFGRVRDSFSGVSSQVPWSCWSAHFLRRWMNLVADCEKEFHTGSWKLKKTLCFVTNTLVIAGAVGEKGRCSRVTTSSLGDLCKPCSLTVRLSLHADMGE